MRQEDPNEIEARREIHAHTHTLDMESLILKEAGFTGKSRDIINAIAGAANTRVSPVVVELSHVDLARRLNHPSAKGEEKRDKKAAITYVSRKLDRLEREMKEAGVMIVRIVRGNEEQRTRYEVFLTTVAHRAYRRAYASELWKEHPGKAKSAQVAQALAELPPYESDRGEDRSEDEGASEEKMIARRFTTIKTLAQQNFKAVAGKGESPKAHYERLAAELRALAEIAEQQARPVGKRYVIRRDTSAAQPAPPKGGGTHKSVDTPPVSNAEHAKRYARAGVRVFALHSVFDGICSCADGSECQSKGKHPLAAVAPRGVKDATTDPARIDRMWGAHPHANIGAAMGGPLRLFALDVDGRNGGFESLQELKREHGDAWLETKQHRTGDGFHYLFTVPEGVRLKGKLADGIDVKAGDGSYIVMPPSEHATGRVYAVVRDDAPAPAPAWLLRRLTEEERPAAVPFDKTRARAKSGPATGEIIAEGGRNRTLFEIGCSMRGKGAGQEEIEAELLGINARRCSPPLADSEIIKIARSCARLAANRVA
jgi:hypothetical protein